MIPNRKSLGLTAVIIAFVFELVAACGFLTNYIVQQHHVSMDYYQFWAVGVGPKISNGQLKSPYANPSKYVETLDAYVQKNANDIRLVVGNKVNHEATPTGLDIPGTPLLYALFSLAPLNYSQGFLILSWAKVLAFVAGISLLILHQKEKFLLTMPLALIVGLLYGPMAAELKFGNLSILQFSITALFAYLLERNAKTKNSLFDTLYLPSLLLFVLVKPNIVFVAIALSASFWAIRGTKRFLTSSAIAMLCGLVFAAIPCLYYNSWTVWTDWLHYLSRLNTKGYYPFNIGNTSTTLLLADTFNVSTATILPLVLFVLFAHVCLNVLRTKPKATSLPHHARRAIALLKDPFLCVSIGVVVLLSTSPLVWLHYYVLSLIPAFWLLAKKPTFGPPDCLALISLILSTGIIPMALPQWQATKEYYVMTSAWVPLWLGAMMVVTAKLKALNLAEERR